jgi:DNA polymerase III subunit delta
MTIENILADIKKRAFKPVYFLHGEESYYIDFIADLLDKVVLTEAEKGFNQTILYGKEVDMLTIISTAKRYPMMSDFQLVIVKEAQNIKFGKGDTKDADPFASYLENPLKSTVLVFCHKYGSLDKRLKIAKAIEKNGVLFESKKLYDNQVSEWAMNFVGTKGFKLDTKAGAMVAEYLGNDLSKVANELEKVMINMGDRKTITMDDIQKNVGISKEYNTFEFNTAIAKRDVLKANKIVDYFAANKKENPLVVTIGQLNTYFSKIFTYYYLADKSKSNIASALKINPYFVQEYEQAAKNYNFDKTCQVISLLREYDLKSKGLDSTGNTDEGELLKELVWKILH